MISKLFATLGIFLFVAPIALLTGTGMAGRPLYFIPPVLAALMLSFGIRLIKRGRTVVLIPAMLLLAAGVVYIGRMHGLRWTVVAPSVACAVLMMVHVKALCMAPGEEYAPVTWYAGVAVHGISLFLLRAVTLAPAAPYVRTAATLYFIYIIFALNEQNVMNGMAGSRRPSQQMRLRNRIRAGLLAAAVAILGNLDALRRLVDKAVDILLRVIGWLIDLLTPEFETVTSEGGGGMDLGGLAGAIEEPALIWRILEEIMRYGALIAAAVLALLIVWKFSKVLKKFARWLMKQLREYMNHVSDAYDDTVESLLDWGEFRRAVRDGRSRLRIRREERVQWDTLTPRETVRKSYQLLRRKSAGISDARTARTAILSGDMPLRDEDMQSVADTYDAARYSSLEISAEDAAHVRKAAQKRR